MHINSLKAEVLDITIREHVYPVQKIGVAIPCLMLCLGSPSWCTISSSFSKFFEIYSSDLYWIKNATYPDDPLTLNIILDDIKSQRTDDYRHGIKIRGISQKAKNWLIRLSKP